MKAIQTILLFLTTTCAMAQSGSFVHIPCNANSLTLGRSSMNQTDASGLYTNTASLPSSRSDYSASVSYTQWNNNLGNDYQLYTATAHAKWNQRNAMAIGYRQYRHPSYMGMDESGNRQGNYTPQEMAVDLGYAHQFSEKISGGITARFIQSDMGAGYSAEAFGFDINALYRETHWQLDFSVKDIGSPLDYGNTAYRIPARVQMGGSYRIKEFGKHCVNTYATLLYQFTPSEYTGTEFHLGAEYVFMRKIYVQAGHRFADKEKTGSSYSAFGLGASLPHVRINAAYLTAPHDSPQKGNLSLGLTLTL